MQGKHIYVRSNAFSYNEVEEIWYLHTVIDSEL